MREKLTQGEQAEKQANAFNKSALAGIDKPPTTIGPKECTNCGDDIPTARRKVYGNGLCVDCAELKEQENR